VALGVGFACALRFGEVACWGSGGNESVASWLTPGTYSTSPVSTLDFGTNRRVTELSAGWRHVCVVFEDQRARCWGENESGQLGLGHTETYGDDPEETLAALPDLPLERLSRISAGVRNTCAIEAASPTAPGRVHCWGSDRGGAVGDRSSGAYGDDEIVDGSRPVALPADAVQVATGGDLACALLVTGAVHCWGDNWAKTLGIGDTTCDIGDEQPCIGEQGRAPDIPVSGLGSRTIVKLRVNQASACVVDHLGALLCWGRNSQSRIGYPELVEGEFLGAPPSAVDLGEDVAVVDVALGVRHTCALDTQGRVRCFGERGPALGYGMPAEQGVAGIGGTLSPAQAYELREDEGIVDVGDLDGTEGLDVVEALFAGGNTTCVRITNGDVRCWGANTAGELGYGAGPQVGAIGDETTPGRAYERLGRSSIFVEP
jgi:alpha-tubulin suppressor-like RCC1 family protein